MPKLKLPRPRPLPYDALKLSRASWAQKVKSASRAWAIQGYGAPKTVYIFYVVKVFLFLLGALFLCSIADGWVTTRALHDNLLDLESFKRVLLYSMMFELLGLGCGSGPLTARYVPPIAACLHFGRPGTVKLPFLKRLRFRRTTRGWIEASLYWCLIGISLFNLFGPKIDHIHLSWTSVSSSASAFPTRRFFLLLAANTTRSCCFVYCFHRQAYSVPYAFKWAYGSGLPYPS